jgi:hypothetical protein
MSASSHNDPDFDPVILLGAIGALVALAVLMFFAVEWPVFVWSLIHARPMLLDPASAIGGGIDLLFSSKHAVRHVEAWKGVAGLLPPPAAWVVLDLTGGLVAFVCALAAGVRLERGGPARRAGGVSSCAPWSASPARTSRPATVAIGSPASWASCCSSSRSATVRLIATRLVAVLMARSPRRGRSPGRAGARVAGAVEGAWSRSGITANSPRSAPEACSSTPPAPSRPPSWPRSAARRTRPRGRRGARRRRGAAARRLA